MQLPQSFLFNITLMALWIPSTNFHSPYYFVTLSRGLLNVLDSTVAMRVTTVHCHTVYIPQGLPGFFLLMWMDGYLDVLIISCVSLCVLSRRWPGLIENYFSLIMLYKHLCFFRIILRVVGTFELCHSIRWKIHTDLH